MLKLVKTVYKVWKNICKIEVMKDIFKDTELISNIYSEYSKLTDQAQGQSVIQVNGAVQIREIS